MILRQSEFETMMRERIKRAYIEQYLVGRGGRAKMTQVDWGSIGGMLAEQYRYLDGFAAEVAAGVLSAKQISARSRMYVRSSKEAYERGRRRWLLSLDDKPAEVRWILQPAEHCPDCLALAALRWILISDDAFDGCFPGSGCTQCLTNCACFLDYR